MSAGHPWRIESRGELALVVAIFIYLAPQIAYQIANVALRPFARAATTQYKGVDFSWLRIPCDNRWLGYKASYREGIGREHVMLCLTADGWVTVSTDKDPSTPSRPSVSP